MRLPSVWGQTERSAARKITRIESLREDLDPLFLFDIRSCFTIDWLACSPGASRLYLFGHLHIEA